LATQSVCSGGHGAHRVRASLLFGARIGVAYRGREGIQPLLEGVPVSREDVGAHRGHPFPAINDDHLAVLDTLLAPAHRVLVGLRDDPVDLEAQLPL